MFTEIDRCRICANRNLVPVLDLGSQALTGVFRKPGQEPPVKSPLHLVKCHPNGHPGSCGLLQLKHSVDPALLYGKTYGYRSGINPAMARHLKDKARQIKNLADLQQNDLVIDIGSNDGTLLKAYLPGDLHLVGIDPLAEKFRDEYPKDIQLICDFFSKETLRRHLGNRKARAVTSIAMYYDVESPLDFMRQVYDILDDDGVWMFEQSYLPGLLKANSYDTVCHEHLEYYALGQVKWMADLVGFKIVDVDFNGINGGSFAVAAAKNTNQRFPECTQLIQKILREEENQGLSSLSRYEQFKLRAMKERGALRDLVHGFSREGKKVFGYGASTKGNVILQYCGFSPQDIPWIAEINAEKFGCLAPGSGIPIISEAEAMRMNPEYFLVFPWHFNEAIIHNQGNYLTMGGKFILPLPELTVYGRDS